MLITPVLLLVFNRPEQTRVSFGQIKKVKPKYLFVAADGPRQDRPDDIQKCMEVKRIVSQIDWDCTVKTLFREQNRGCGHGPAEAISWFFAQVEQGIVLEDDCVADVSFFSFCEELLDRFKHDQRVSMIGGTNPVIQWKQNKHSYLVSNMGFSWGWASWRRAWQDFDYTASMWFTPEASNRVKAQFNNSQFFNHFQLEFDHYFSKVRSDVWDFQWLFCRLNKRSYTLLPSVNLIANIGFDQESTHTFHVESNIAFLKTQALNFPLKHPPFKVDRLFDWYVFERFVNPQYRPLWKKVILKIIKKILTNQIKA